MLVIVFIYLSATELFAPGHDSLRVSGGGAALAIALSALAFSYSRAVADSVAVRTAALSAGEMMFQSVFLFLLAAIYRYAAVDVPSHIEALACWRGVALTSMDVRANRGIEQARALAALLFFVLGIVLLQKGIRVLMAAIAVRVGKSTRRTEGSWQLASRRSSSTWRRRGIEHRQSRPTDHTPWPDRTALMA